MSISTGLLVSKGFLLFLGYTLLVGAVGLSPQILMIVVLLGLIWMFRKK